MIVTDMWSSPRQLDLRKWWAKLISKII